MKITSVFVSKSLNSLTKKNIWYNNEIMNSKSMNCFHNFWNERYKFAENTFDILY